MSDFITDGSAVLPAVKTDARSPSGANTEVKAADLNQVRQALLDLRREVLSMEQSAAFNASVVIQAAAPEYILVRPRGNPETLGFSDRCGCVKA